MNAHAIEGAPNGLAAPAPAQGLERIDLDGDERVVVHQSLEECKAKLDRFTFLLHREIGTAIPSPSAATQLAVALISALGELGNLTTAPITLTATHAPVLKTAISATRRKVATENDRLRAEIFDAELVARLEGQLVPYETLLNKAWMMRVGALPMPKLADFLTANAIQRLESAKELAPREYEPKSRILLSSSLIWPDLAMQRRACEERNVPLAVAFADADRFKQLNTELGEPIVDRDVLPVLMRAIERAVFGRGAAYRHGGDEFLLVLPNADRDAALMILRQVQSGVRACRYLRAERTITLSIGCIVVPPDSVLTDREIVERAAVAKAAAKSRRDAIALIGGELTSVPSIAE